MQFTDNEVVRVAVCSAHESLAAAIDADFLRVVDGDIATYVAAYLQSHRTVAGIWWELSSGYSPALIARDIATLSHLGAFDHIAINGEMSEEAVEVIAALLRDEPVTMSSAFGDLEGAMNRPAITQDIDVYVGRESDGVYSVQWRRRVSARH